jgi:DNA-binding NarL/FixJ family response regulator
VSATAARPLALIAAREPALRAGMRLALEPGVRCEEAESPAQAIELMERECPDVCFLDADGGSGGLRATELIRQFQPGTTVVLLAHTVSEEEFLQAVRVGAAGYLPESIPPERLPAVVESVMRGEAVVPRALVRRLFDEFRNLGRRRLQLAPGRAVQLTRRESEVLDFVRQGMTTRAIARRLGVADVTVRRHRSSLFAKLQVRSRSELLLLLETSGAANGAAGATSGYGFH